jgi:hypothetical protein
MRPIGSGCWHERAEVLARVVTSMGGDEPQGWA